jgi:putative transposase
MAIANRRPLPKLIHNSDRRVQYACGPYRKRLGRHDITASMSRKGNCWDNAPMESFFSSLKTEMVHRTRFQTLQEAKAALFEYIEIFTPPLQHRLPHPSTSEDGHGTENSS